MPLINRTNRKEVYKVIDEERDYQDDKWGDELDDAQWAINDWIVFIERYIQEAKNNTGQAEALDSVRKIAALAVACMEYNGALRRE